MTAHFPIQAAASRSLQEPHACPAIAAALGIFEHYLTGAAIEHAALAAFDRRGRLVHFSDASGAGTRVAGIVAMCRAALGRTDSSVLVLGHNHPSGDLLPSRADIEVTRRISALCRLSGTRLAGHLLFAGERCLAFGTEGSNAILPLASAQGRSYSAALPGSGAAPRAQTGVKVGE